MAEVVAPDLSVDPEVALAAVREICREVKTDLIVGSSYGSFLGQQVVCDESGEQIGDEIVHRAISGMLDLANDLQLLIDGLDDRPLPEQQLVMQTHQRVLHVPLEPGDQVYAVHEESLEEILADVSPIGEQLAKQLFREAFVFLRSAVVDIARGQLPLHDLALVVDDQVQLESVEPAHRALAQGRQSPHRPMR